MTSRIARIIQIFYHVITKREIIKRRFKSCSRLAWFCLRKMKEPEFDLTWDEAQEAAALMLEEANANTSL